MYNITIIKVKELVNKRFYKKHLKIQITIYKWLRLMYNINIIKVKELTLKVPNKLNFLEVNQYEKTIVITRIWS